MTSSAPAAEASVTPRSRCRYDGSHVRSERVVFSRFLASQDWRPAKLRRKVALRALVAVAAPSDLTTYQLAEVDRDGEISRAREGLGEIRSTVLGKDEPLTLERLVAGLRLQALAPPRLPRVSPWHLLGAGALGRCLTGCPTQKWC